MVFIDFKMDFTYFDMVLSRLAYSVEARCPPNKHFASSAVLEAGETQPSEKLYDCGPTNEKPILPHILWVPSY